MTEQQPTRFENYPPEATTTPFAGADPAPTPPPAVYSPPAPAARPQRTHSRRGVIVGLIALAVGGPTVARLGADLFSASGTPDYGTETWAAEPSEEPTAEPSEDPMDDPSEFTAGDYGGPVPSGWRVTSTDDGAAVLAKGANQVTVLSWAPASDRMRPLDDIAEAVKRAATGFSGSLGKPVNESTGTRALATLSGKGTFEGKPAREFAELWLDDNNAYLLIVTVLTAKEGSATARQATDIAWNLTSGLR